MKGKYVRKNTEVCNIIVCCKNVKILHFYWIIRKKYLFVVIRENSLIIFCESRLSWPFCIWFLSIFSAQIHSITNTREVSCIPWFYLNDFVTQAKISPFLLQEKQLTKIKRLLANKTAITSKEIKQFSTKESRKKLVGKKTSLVKRRRWKPLVGKEY